MADKDERIDWILKQIQKIKEDMESLDQDRAEALRFYRSAPEIVEFKKGRSKATTTDMMDTIEWIKPSLLEIFASGDEVVSLQPAGEEDTVAVENQNLLVNQQLRVKNNWFMLMHDWIDDALKCKTGAIKYQWFKKVETIDKEYEGLTPDEFAAIASKPNTSVVSKEERILKEAVIDDFGKLMEPAVVEIDCVVQITVEDEYPLLEVCPAEEVGFPLNMRDIKTCPFFYHRVRYEPWEFKKKFGEKKYDEYKQRKDDETQTENERLKDLGGKDFYWDEQKGQFIGYECYFFDPDTGKPLVCDVVADEVFDERDNKYRKPPFHVITPIKMAHRVAGLSIYDLIKELQQIRTAILRQILDNLYFANNRRYFGDPERLNVDDYLNSNFPGALIRTEGDPRAVVMPEEKAPLPPETFTFWEMLNTEKDYHSGVPRSFQGVNPNVLNKTWRGQNEQVNQASQRISMMARLIAEMGVAPLVTDVVDLNIRFLKKKTSVRYLNSWKDISPDNIIGKYDSIVNVGLGTGNKQQTIVNVQQLLGLYAQIQKAGVPIVTPQNVYNAMKELIKAMGFRNTADFVSDPAFNERIKRLLMMLMQLGVVQVPQIGMQVQMLAVDLGLIPDTSQAPPPGQSPPGGTFPGQQPPAQPNNPMNPMQITAPAQEGNFG